MVFYTLLVMLIAFVLGLAVNGTWLWLAAAAFAWLVCGAIIWAWAVATGRRGFLGRRL